MPRKDKRIHSARLVQEICHMPVNIMAWPRPSADRPGGTGDGDI